MPDAGLIPTLTTPISHELPGMPVGAGTVVGVIATAVNELVQPPLFVA